MTPKTYIFICYNLVYQHQTLICKNVGRCADILTFNSECTPEHRGIRLSITMIQGITKIQRTSRLWLRPSKSFWQWLKILQSFWEIMIWSCREARMNYCPCARNFQVNYSLFDGGHVEFEIWVKKNTFYIDKVQKIFYAAMEFRRPDYQLIRNRLNKCQLP